MYPPSGKVQYSRSAATSTVFAAVWLFGSTGHTGPGKTCGVTSIRIAQHLSVSHPSMIDRKIHRSRVGVHRSRSRRGARMSPMICFWVHRKADADIRIKVSTADVSSICIVAEAQDTAHTGKKTHATDQAACAGKQAGTTVWRRIQYRHIPSLPVGSNLILPNPDHRDTKRNPSTRSPYAENVRRSKP